MGSCISCCCSLEPPVHRNVPADWIVQFHALQISNTDVNKLYDLFHFIDTDNSGTLDILELFNFLDVEVTPFTKRVFTIFDPNQSGKVDFREFVISMWNYCTLGKNTLG